MMIRLQMVPVYILWTQEKRKQTKINQKNLFVSLGAKILFIGNLSIGTCRINYDCGAYPIHSSNLKESFRILYGYCARRHW